MQEEDTHASALQAAPRPKESAVVCALIWFHHIKSFTKRKHILSSAQELDIRGFCKPGFPGIIVCEGLESDVADFISSIRQLKWQAMSVRAMQSSLPDNESSRSVDAVGASQASEVNRDNCQDHTGEAMQTKACTGRSRRFSEPFAELDERGMDQMAAACQQAGLENLFLTALKIQK